VDHIVELSGHLELALIACSLLFWATAGYALASFLGVRRRWATPVSAVFPVLGLVAIALVALRNREKERRSEHQRARDDAAAPTSAPGGFEASAASPVGVNDSGFAPFSSAQPVTHADTAWGVSEFGLADSGFADTGFGDVGFRGQSFNDQSFGGAIPTVVPAVASARTPFWGGDWLPRRVALVAVGATVVALACLVVTLALPWFSVDSGLSPRFWVFAVGNGIDIVLYATGIALVIALIGLVRHPSRWAAILIALFADWWLLIVLAVVSTQQSLQELLDQIGAFRFTVGQMLSGLGATSHAGVIQLPKGVDLSSIGIAGNSIDAGSINLTAALHNVDLQLGVSWWLLVAFVIMANVVVVIVLREAHFAQRKRKRTVTV